MSLERIAFEHAVQRMDAQRADLANTRNQAAISAAITGLIGTFFATVVSGMTQDSPLSGDFLWGFSLPSVLLFFVFAVSIAMAILVVIQLDECHFSFNTSKMVENISEFATDKDYFVSYAQDGEWYFQDNEGRIARAQCNLWWAMVLGWSQIVPWIVIIGSAEAM